MNGKRLLEELLLMWSNWSGWTRKSFVPVRDIFEELEFVCPVWLGWLDR